jgi:hypothetical protein
MKTKRELKNEKYNLELTELYKTMDENEIVFEELLFKTNDHNLIKSYCNLKSSIISVIQKLKESDQSNNH